MRRLLVLLLLLTLTGCGELAGIVEGWQNKNVCGRGEKNCTECKTSSDCTVYQDCCEHVWWCSNNADRGVPCRAECEKPAEPDCSCRDGYCRIP